MYNLCVFLLFFIFPQKFFNILKFYKGLYENKQLVKKRRLCMWHAKLGMIYLFLLLFAPFLKKSSSNPADIFLAVNFFHLKFAVNATVLQEVLICYLSFLVHPDIIVVKFL